MAYSKSMQGKVVLITGGTDGIGAITARSLAGMGATTVIVGRNPQKTAQKAQEIREATGNEQVTSFVADLSSQAQIRRLAEEFQNQHDRLDVLVNNAGGFFINREVSADGIEMTFALNHLSYFLLTHLLLNLLEASKPSRIINVSSEAHRGKRINSTDLENQRSYNGWKAYGQSKLANIYFTYGLAATLHDTSTASDVHGVTPGVQGVTANALHPGFVATNIGKNNGNIYRFLLRLAHVAAVTPEEGARTSIYLAASPDVNNVTGKYFLKCQAVPSSHISQDMDAARKLWECSLEMTGLPSRK